MQCDVTKPEDCARAAAAVAGGGLFGGARLGCLFANAGVIFPSRGLLKSKPADWRTTFEVNVLGVVNTLQAFVPLLQQQSPNEPSVVCTTASIAGLIRAPPGLVNYAASKHAVVALTEGLSFELAKPSPQIRVRGVPCRGVRMCVVRARTFIHWHAAWLKPIRPRPAPVPWPMSFCSPPAGRLGRPLLPAP